VAFMPPLPAAGGGVAGCPALAGMPMTPGLLVSRGGDFDPQPEDNAIVIVKHPSRVNVWCSFMMSFPPRMRPRYARRYQNPPRALRVIS
jgi:hypothetical protein